jgi:anti-sigma factor RsiW
VKARNIVELMCTEVVELITEYLSRTMAPAERVRMEQHLLACPPCTAHLQQVRTTVELAHGLRAGQETEAPEGEDLLGLFRRWNRR